MKATIKPGAFGIWAAFDENGKFLGGPHGICPYYGKCEEDHLHDQLIELYHHGYTEIEFDPKCVELNKFDHLTMRNGKCIFGKENVLTYLRMQLEDVIDNRQVEITEFRVIWKIQ